MTTTSDVPEARVPRPDADGPWVARDVCETRHAQQDEANRRTWEEIRSLRRLVILLVVGGHLFTGGLNLAGLGYWLQQHADQPHPATLHMLAAVRAEAREDLRDLRREVHQLLLSVAGSPAAPPPATPPNQGGSR